MNTIGMIVDTLPLRAIDFAGLYNTSYYVGMCGDEASWPGGSFYEEFPRNSGEYREVYFTADESQIGVAVDALGSVTDHSVWDRTNSLIIDFYTATVLADATELQLTQTPELNCFAVRNPTSGLTEIIQFKNASVGTPPAGFQSRWTVSTFLRGRIGTEKAVASHAVGDQVMLIDFTLRHLNYSVSDIGA